MKQLVFSIFCLFMVMSCSVTNRIVVTDDSQMKTIKLAQSPDASIIKNNNLSKPIDLEVISVYLCEEIKDIRPQVTVNFQIKKLIDYPLSDATVVINLDNENIDLNSLNYNVLNVSDSLQIVNQPDTVYQKDITGIDTIATSRSGRLKKSFVIPENLWVPIIHANTVKYKIKNEEKEIEIKLSQSEKSMLDKFLGMTIKDRNDRFPAIPEGQKKW